ncbi:MAG: AMIN domain-containing protein [Campylobacterota bacterium]
MRRLLPAIMFLPLLLAARENPFTPVEITKTYETPQAVTVEPEVTVAKPKAVVVKPSRKKIADPKPRISAEKSSDKQELYAYAKARFVFKENSAYIKTKDEMIKHFVVSNPPRIVIDFRSTSKFTSKRQELTTKPFKKLEMGAHSDSYRVVLRLDGEHNYKVDKRKDGQVVTILD